MPIDHIDLGVALSLISIFGAGFIFVWANVRTTTLATSINGLKTLNDAQAAEIKDLRAQVEDWKTRYAGLQSELAEWKCKYEQLSKEFEGFKETRRTGRRS